MNGPPVEMMDAVQVLLRVTAECGADIVHVEGLHPEGGPQWVVVAVHGRDASVALSALVRRLESERSPAPRAQERRGLHVVRGGEDT